MGIMLGLVQDVQMPVVLVEDMVVQVAVVTVSVVLTVVVEEQPMTAAFYHHFQGVVVPYAHTGQVLLVALV